MRSFISAAKSRQNTLPAKRRKVVADIEAIPTKSAKLVDGKCVNLRQEKVALNGQHATRAKTSSKTTRGNRSRVRSSKARREVTQSKMVSDGVVSVTTSLEDDHETTKPRKQSRAKVPLLTKATELATGPAAELKASQTESKTAPAATQVPEKAHTPITSPTVKPGNIQSQSRSGLAIDPWISEQSKLVLASRGRQALEKSLGRRKATGNSSKKVEQKVSVQETPKAEKSYSVKRKVDVPRLSQGVAMSTAKPISTSGESASNLPAYKRFSHLLEAKKPKPAGVTQNLPLPYHFKVLEEMFRCVDVVLSLKQKRYETCTFEKLKDAVQEMCRKKFEKKHLAQMKAVYPTAFSFHQQSSSCSTKKSGYQLTIDFNLDESQGQKAKDFKFIESSLLIARQKQFKNELLKITMNHHRQYLVKNYPSLTVDDDAIMRWHPCFPLDEVPEVDVSPLPVPPQVKTYSTAQDVLDQARQNMTPRVEKALNLVAKKSAENNNVNSGVKTMTKNKDPSQVKNQNPSLKGVSQSLIDKIRQKEEKKVQESLTLDSEVVQKRIMTQRLPELCRILKTYFISERKAAIPLEDVSNKLAESYTSSLSPVQVEKHVKLLSEMVPEWVSIMYVRKCPYVKLKKNVNINGLMEKLRSKEVN